MWTKTGKVKNQRFWAINIGPKQLAGKGQEVNRRKLPPIGLTPFELAPTLMNKMGVVQNVYYPNGDTPIF